MTAFEFTTTKQIISEPGSLARLPEICANLGINKPYIITDPGIVSVGLLAQLDESMAAKAMAYGVFSDVVADPPDHLVMAAVEAAIAAGADGIVGFGGGSSLDTAKLVALLVHSEQSLSDLYGIDNATGPRLPLVLIPTTAGTGSEATAVAIVTTGETTKSGVVSKLLYPDVALLDANLTIGLPAHVTAATGIDAMVHAIEAFTSVHKKNPYSDMVAREALRLLSANIYEATFNGGNLVARQNMLLGACLAGQAFANSPVAAVHALAYPLGGRFHIPHGLCNSLVLPHVLRFNAEAAEHWYAELNDCLADAKPGENSAASCANFISSMEQLILALGIPTKLSDMGISAEDIPQLAEDAMLQTRLLINNPVDVTLADALNIYHAALTGINNG
ncbi:iron-containing alcohol dehydrogenase [uncultured Umboniibacter sp.]|uniref:iron-containing alcohol dehydrogenase n=1 Tax=uncultured Umboniibacter sp. TaxID=1798917 RepID=UPI00261D1729|nr:iron-containing alcohol dehydrogenase [uncultured Umboniibacter sp.]